MAIPYQAYEPRSKPPSISYAMSNAELADAIEATRKHAGIFGDIRTLYLGHLEALLVFQRQRAACVEINAPRGFTENKTER